MNLLIGYYISRYFLLKPGSTSLFICPLPWLKAELRQGNALPTTLLVLGEAFYFFQKFSIGALVIGHLVLVECNMIF